MMRKECHAFLAYVKEDKEEGLKLEEARVVYEYPNAFLDELPRLPPEREVEFPIDLALDTQPISIPPYRMAQVELKELKKQL